MLKQILRAILLIFILSACTAPQSQIEIQATNTPLPLPTLTQMQSTSAVPTTEPATIEPNTPVIYPDFSGESLVADRGELFSGAGACTFCHTNMQDAKGRDVSIDKSWSASMMANASKDPYWLATVRSEIELEPGLREVIEAKCATCHMPMASVSAAAKGEETRLLDDGFASPDHPLNGLAMDGISCNVCHQIEPDNFGQQDSFSGGFLVDMGLSSSQRKAYGPYQVGNQFVNLMQGTSGYIPLQGKHMAQAELCGTCHNLVTPFVDANGQVLGEFPEQAIYSEWLNSSYNQQKGCVECHMPAAEGSIQLSITGGPPRSPFSEHIFAGGNAFMLNVLRLYGEEIGVTTSSAYLEQAVLQAENLIGSQTAAIRLENVSFDGNTLRGEIIIESAVGHKLPAGYPSRRIWVHISVLGSSGATLFESGNVNSDGRISGNDNDDDATRFEPHYEVIHSPDQVQVYEAVMLNSDGEVTTTLLRAAEYAKDNRIPPEGFDLKLATLDTRVIGFAEQDENFLGGGDRLDLEIGLSGVSGPLTIKVELLYQSIGYRWVQNLLQDQSVEAGNFGRYYNSLPNIPLVAAKDEITVQP